MGAAAGAGAKLPAPVHPTGPSCPAQRTVSVTLLRFHICPPCPASRWNLGSMCLPSSSTSWAALFSEAGGRREGRSRTGTLALPAYLFPPPANSRFCPKTFLSHCQALHSISKSLVRMSVCFFTVHVQVHKYFTSSNNTPARHATPKTSPNPVLPSLPLTVCSPPSCIFLYLAVWLSISLSRCHGLSVSFSLI